MTEKWVQFTSRNRTGEGGSRRFVRAFRFSHFLLLISFVLSGCGDCKFLAQNCPSPPDPQSAAEIPAPNAAYLIGCPDILEISSIDFPQWDVLASVDVDGRLPLEHPGNPRVDGRTLDDVKFELAQMASVSPERVSVRLASARSSHIYIHGPIRGRTRIVPYQGPEPVIDMLKRVGGLPPGSKLNQVYVVRPNVAVGTQPEVFRVNVPRVLIHDDQKTNVLLKPSDQVYIGETRQSEFSRLLPDWLAPMYRRLTGLTPEDWWLRKRKSS
jgi:protein involved in polysaccharide export with SLBB domain